MSPSTSKEVKARLQSDDQETRLIAVKLARALPKEEASKLLLSGISHWDRVFRLACAEELSKVDPPAASRAIIQALGTPGFPRREGIRVLAECETPEAQVHLARMVDSSWRDLSALAKKALGKGNPDLLARSMALFTQWDDALETLMRAGKVKVIQEAVQALPEETWKRLFFCPEAYALFKELGLGLGQYAKASPAENLRELLKGQNRVTGDALLVLRQAPKEAVMQWFIAAGPEQRENFSKDRWFRSLLQDKGLLQVLLPKARRPGLLTKIAEKTGLNPTQLGVAVNRWDTLDECYQEFTIPKKNGKTRQIVMPEGWLKYVQRRIYETIVAPAALNEACHGFRQGRSIKSNASAHVGHTVVINLDLRDFFPGISAGRIYGVFVSLGWGSDEARFLTRLCTYKGHLPQGAPTSPGLANLVARRLDSRLTGLSKKVNAHYTRYADDLSFSGARDLIRCLPLITQIITAEGFQIAEEKLRITGPGNRQEVTGLVVNQKVTVPRGVRRKLRALIHNLKRGKAIYWGAGECSEESLRGRVEFVRSIQQELGQRMVNALG